MGFVRRAMPRYFFDEIDNGHLTRDEQGVDCPDLDGAKAEAAKGLAELARDVLPEGTRRELLIRVRDETGRHVFTTSVVLETKDGD